MLVSRAGADAAAAAGTLVVSSHVSPLRLVARFPSQCSTVSGICALDDDCVLLACGALRALRLSSAQLCARDPSPLEDVWNVAFDAATDTLLLALKAKARGSRAVAWLVSLQRVSDEWREVQRMQTEFALSDWVGISFAGDSRALCGQQFKDRLYAFDVSADHRLQPVGTVVLEAAFCRFACTRLGGDSLVAFTDDELVCVCAAADGRRSRVAPRAPRAHTARERVAHSVQRRSAARCHSYEFGRVIPLFRRWSHRPARYPRRQSRRPGVHVVSRWQPARCMGFQLGRPASL